jgi:archaetidylinositol phosphate synthase
MTLQTQTPKFRINDISLGPFERRVLPWMAKRLPHWVVPDHLTAVAQVAAVVIGLGYWLTAFNLNWLWLCNAAFVVHWWGDSLDGTLARVRHIERNRYGFYIDHYSDTIAVFLICFGMGLSPLMDMRIALGLIIGYYLLMILVNLVSMTRGVFKISFGGIGPTEIRLIIMIGNTIIWATHNPVQKVLGHSMTLFSIMGLVIAICLGVYYLIFGEIERRNLSKLDPAPKPEAEAAPDVRTGVTPVK